MGWGFRGRWKTTSDWGLNTENACGKAVFKMGLEGLDHLGRFRRSRGALGIFGNKKIHGFLKQGWRRPVIGLPSLCFSVAFLKENTES